MDVPDTQIGAWTESGRTHFRVWAPQAGRVELVIESGLARRSDLPLDRQPDGFWYVSLPAVPPGTLYRFRLDGRGPYPDPASRFQPFGVHGPSQIVDAAQFGWTDASWPGISLQELVVYELHVGTFTTEGTFAAVAERLPYLAGLGVTAIELMPVADFPGRRNWGYDGVSLFAPARCYGTPDDLRVLVDAAHRHGLAVVLDVVYNHLGPDGNYLGHYSPHYFSARHRSPWGPAINLDGPHSRFVREFFIQNAVHWVCEYHLDGLRLDATHAMFDGSGRHFLAELAGRVRAAGPGRPVLLIAEDHRNLAHMVKPESAGGWAMDAVWSDDFHHCLRRLLTGDRDGYFGDFDGSTHELARILDRGWLYCGQYSRHFGEPRGTDPAGLAPPQFVFFLQNHDQVGNPAQGRRLHHQVDEATYRAAVALLLSLPYTPLLFMGQEWSASTPFRYFTDHEPELGRKVAAGRRREFRHFRSYSDPRSPGQEPDPQDPAAFTGSRLCWPERHRPQHAAVLHLHRRLLHLRRSEPAMRCRDRQHFAAWAPNDRAVAVYRRSATEDRHLLVVVQLRGSGMVCPFQRSAGPNAPHRAVPTARRWQRVLSTEEPAFARDPVPVTITATPAGPQIQFRRPGALFLLGQ